MIKKSWLKSQITFVLNLHKKGFSRKEISKKFNDKYPTSPRTQDSIKHCIDVYGAYVEKAPKKVLILDIETKPMTAKVWGLFDQNIALNQIVDEGGIFSWSAKWIDSDEVIYKDVKGKKSKEKELLKPIWKLMDEADIIIGQNSDSFDIKKKHFKFVSNKLEYMSKKFCKIKKLAHSKFPGFSLWDECEKGNLAAWKEMRLYNMADVQATEELFLELSQFDKTEVVQDALKAYKGSN